MNKYLYFGEKVPQYDIAVFNERELRAGAGILLIWATISFASSCMSGNFIATKIFLLAFMIDFLIRLFTNPKYAPTLILGRLAVSRQVPEYSGAIQKRWAWSGGLAMSTIMFYLLFIAQTVNLLTISICVVCLIMLFFETAFGICIGCKLYNLFHKDKAKLCPGGVCEVHKKESIQEIKPLSWLIVLAFFLTLFFLGRNIVITNQQPSTSCGVSSPETVAPCLRR